jgi:glucose/arabinose dehydrogenase
MRHILNLALVGLVGLVVIVGFVWVFRGQVLRPFGVSFDTGAATATALRTPDGYRADIFASGLKSPRFMAVSGQGVLFVADPGAGRVIALPDRDGDGRADDPIVVGEGFDAAHSLAFETDGSLLVAGSGTLFRVTLDGDLREASREELASYPRGGQHSTRTVITAADGTILVSLGSSCNVCWEDDERRASIFSVEPVGGAWRVVMRGLRNAVGVAVDPATGAVWATNNGRDMMGDDLPPETLYRVVDGSDAGWPRCHAGVIPDPDLGDEPDSSTGAVGCAGVAPPDATFGAHMAPLGIAFWEGHAVIAFHGSWNRSSKVGYEVRWMPWDDGPTGPDEMLAGGFLDQDSGDASGRPAGVVVGADGALYVSDDKGGFIYRISAA